MALYHNVEIIMEQQPLTKEQLESLGFSVEEKQLKKYTKIRITYGGNYSYYFEDFYHYPTFSEIIGGVIRNVREYETKNIKDQLFEKMFN
jgi:hypothetical protein